MQKFPKFNFISVIWNYLKHPDAATGRGENFVDKRQIRTFILQLSNQFLPAFFSTQNSFYAWKDFLWCIFWKLLHHLTLPLLHAGVKIDAPALRNHGIFLQKVGRLWQRSHSFLGVSWGQKHQKLKYWLLLKSGDFIKTLFLKT